MAASSVSYLASVKYGMIRLVGDVITFGSGQSEKCMNLVSWRILSGSQGCFGSPMYFECSELRNSPVRRLYGL